MASDLIQFAWHIPHSGYELVQAHAPLIGLGKHRQELFLKRVSEGSSAVTRYYPLHAHTGLFKTFATTDPAPDSLLKFANKYGWLGIGTLIRVGDRTEAEKGERLNDWIADLLKMRHLVELWGMIVAGNTKALRERIIWHGDDAVEYKPRHAPRRPKVPFYEPEAWIARADLSSRDFLDRVAPGDVVQPATEYLRSELNKALDGKVLNRVLWNEGKLAPYIVPNNLLGAMWLQFAHATGSNREYRRCAECGAWFAVSLDTNRKSRRYCSDPCRVKAYRTRKQEKAQ